MAKKNVRDEPLKPQDVYKRQEFMRAISIVFVVIHVYWFCYRALVDAGINIGVVDKILRISRGRRGFSATCW